jgi:two-component system, NarL family, sensor histidine kinase DesK
MIEADVPRAVDAVDPVRSELFGWVVREAVTNVVRHARAHRCEITVGPTFVEVVDDGVGMLGGPPTPGDNGHGLAGLKARIEAAGGTLTVGWGADGWKVRADVADVRVAPSAVTDRDLFVPPGRPRP